MEDYFLITLELDMHFKEPQVMLNTLLALISFVDTLTSRFKLVTEQSEVFKKPENRHHLKLVIVDQQMAPMSIERQDTQFIVKIS